MFQTKNIFFMVIIKTIILMSLLFHMNVKADKETYIDDTLRYTMVEKFYVEGAELKNALDSTSYFSPIKYEPRNGNYEAVLYYVSKKPNVDLNESITLKISCLPSSQCRYTEHPIRGNSVWNLRSDGIEPFVKQAKEWLSKQDPSAKIIKVHSSSIALTEEKPQMLLKMVGKLPKANENDYAMLIITYYVRDKKYGNAPKFLDSDKYINVYQSFVVLVVVSFLTLMFLFKRTMASRVTTSVGILLTILGLIYTLIWDVNYMVIGTGLIALAGAFLIFGNGIGKIIYFLGLVLIAYVSADKFGAFSSPFFYRIGLLSFIGLLVLFLPVKEPEHHGEYTEKFVYEEQSEEEIQKEMAFNQRLNERMEFNTKTNYANLGLKIRVTVLCIALIGIIFALVL